MNNSTAVFIYDGKEILAETTTEGTKTNIFGNNMIATTGTDTLYYQYNNHGDVVRVLDQSGTLKNEYDYDAFGNAITEKETVKNPYRYAGYYQDTESGLYYLRSRYYNPKTARFLTEDTASGKYTDPLSLNKYTYCHNQPVTGYDPDGHALHIVAGAVLGGVIGGVMGGISAAKNGGSVWKGALGGAVEGALVGGVGAATGGLGIGYAMAAVAGAAGTAGAKIVGGALNAGSKAVSKAASHVLGKVGNQAAMKAGGSVLSKTIASSISGGITGAAAGASADLGMQATQIYLGVDNKDKIDFSQTAQSALLGGVIGAGVGAGSQTKFGQKVTASAKTGKGQLETKIDGMKEAFGKKVSNPFKGNGSTGSRPRKVNRGCLTLPSGKRSPQTTRVRHYTNSKGLKGIKETGTVIAQDNNRVYLEMANKKPLSQIEAEMQYQLGRGKGRNYIEFDVDSSLLEWIENPRYHRSELTIKGDVEVNNAKYYKR